MNAKDNTHTQRPQTDDEKRDADEFYAAQFANAQSEVEKLTKERDDLKHYVAANAKNWIADAGKLVDIRAHFATLRREAVEIISRLGKLPIDHQAFCATGLGPGRICDCGQKDTVAQAAAFVAKHGGESGAVR